MASRPINVVIKGDYSDRDIKRAIRDLKSLETQGTHASRLLSDSGKRIAAGLAIGAAAVGAFVAKTGVDAVQAAIEEEQSVGRLTTTLGNLGLAHKDAGVEAFIDDMQFATGIADNQMRPAYDRLVRSIGNVDEANRALRISLDVAVAKGRDVQQVADVMGKAYDGNTMALSRLGVGIDRTILKTGDMQRITEALTAKFGGQAGAAANTLGGAIKGVGIGWDELVESFGQGLVGSTQGDIDQLKNLQTQLRNMQPSAERAGESLRNVALGAMGTIDRLSAMNDALENHDWGVAFNMIKAGAADDDNAFQQIINTYRLAGKAGAIWKSEAIRIGLALHDQALNARDAAVGGKGVADVIAEQAAAADRLNKSLDRLNGKDRTILSDRLGLRQMLREGPGQSGERETTVPGDKQVITLANGKRVVKQGTQKKTINFTTKDDALAYGLQYAQGVEDLIKDLQADGADSVKLAKVFSRQRRLLEGKLDDTLGKKGAEQFTNQYLATPGWLKSEAGAEEWRRAMEPILPNGPSPATPAPVVNNYYFTGPMNVPTVAAAAQQAKERARLASRAGRGGMGPASPWR